MSKQSDSRDRGLISSLPIPYCANSLLYVDFIHGLPRFGGYDSCLVVTCGLSRFTRVFPCSKKITGEQTVKMLVEQWFEPYGAPKQVHSDEDVRIRSDTGWYKQVLNALNVEVTTGVPYTHTSNPLCERQNRVVEQNVRILMKLAAVKEDADDQLSEIASTIPSVDPSCVDLKHSAFLAQLLLEEVDLESTSEPASPVGKPVLHMQPMHTGEPVARSADALARPAAKNMPLSEHDTQELRRLLYLKAEGIERQERLQYLRQTWKSSIWSEEDDESYTLPDPEIPLVYSLHYGQQCPPEWDDGSVPAETADRQKKKEH